jgi:hypothetical protein
MGDQLLALPLTERSVHRHRHCLLEGSIELAEPRVAVAARVRGDVLVPENQQGGSPTAGRSRG